MANFTRSIMAQAFVLNSLRRGPCRRSELYTQGEEYGLTMTSIDKAAKWFCVSLHVDSDDVFWSLPDNVVAIWWRDASREYEYRPSVMKTA